MNVLTPFQAIDEIRQRSVEAILGLSALNHPALVAEIRRRFGGKNIGNGGLLQEPILEAAFPFVEADVTMASLSGTLLHPSVVDALDLPGEPRIGKDWRPYRHQLDAWRHLADPKPQSVLITSGTGSGKTECFMVPLLDDLAKEAVTGTDPLIGVRAITLYPLNALIASQQDRLGKWTRPFKGKIRYALYNGEMPEDEQASREREVPEQVLSRRTLRSDPPPILVTNVTMLEYLTIRKKDRNILDASAGKLRWIILDEAHSYTGSKAAEIALLLRRVLLAFGVTPDQVRFVATSATIGEGADVTEDLRRFLRDVSGGSTERVHVVAGHRRVPKLPPPDREKRLDDISVLKADPTSAFERLSRNPVVQKQITDLINGPRLWRDVAEQLGETGMQPEDLALAIAGAKTDTDQLLPLRIHAFHRAIPGLWSCINPACTERLDGWAFGRIFHETVDECPACKARVLPLVSCRSCGEPFLDAVEIGRVLHKPNDIERDDEFARDSEDEDATPSEDDAHATSGPQIARLIAVRSFPHARPLNVRPIDARIIDAPDGEAVVLSSHDRQVPERCPCCNTVATTKKLQVLSCFRFGAPAILSNASPVLLQSSPPAIPHQDAEYAPPADGRQLLSFTDSRQGTARFSAKLQSAFERNRVRALIYFSAQESMRHGPEQLAELAKLEEEIADLRKLGPQFRPHSQRLEREREKLIQPQLGPSWETLRSSLTSREEVNHWMRQVWANRDSERFGDTSRKDNLSELLLLRELARRTTRANSLETMGLACLRYRLIEGFGEANLPDALRARGKTIQDWRAFLNVCLTSVARDKFAIRIDPNDAHWLQPGVPPKRLIGPNGQASSKRDVKWPTVSPKNLSNLGTLPRLLEAALELNAEVRADRETINELLELAWRALLPIFSKPGGGGELHLDLSEACIAPVVNAWRCPVTRRVLDTAFCGLSPYGFRSGPKRGAVMQAEPIRLPRHPAPFLSGSGDTECVREWLAKDPDVVRLRSIGLWTNLHDRVSLGAPYARSAEHSAQQPSRRLRKYEAAFRRGEINILNCSTTMEMGVDIGSVSTVMMTNVPPSIANYRQRVGRAGRRRQATALAFTFCRDTPIEREAFRRPDLFLRRAVAAPRVSLDSAPLVQRHVNALLLAAFVRELNGDTTSTKAGAFYGCPSDILAESTSNPPSKAFCAWLAKPSVRSMMGKAIDELIGGSILEGNDSLYENVADAVEKAQSAFRAEWEGLQSQALGLDRETARKSVGFQIRRLCDEFLLSDLSDRGVLPGHGFPTSVVQFIHKDEPDRDEGSTEEARTIRRRFFASRNLDQALRDYAPGADVVIDGMVYRSAGVTLNWKRPAGDSDARDIQSLGVFWHCTACGAADTHSDRIEQCPECGESGDEIKQSGYLRPAGFTADRARAHVEVDFVSYVSPEPPIVAARGTAWHPLRMPDRGRYRASANGLVFYSNAGTVGSKGYSVCLHCGRAQAEDLPGASPFSEHKPLRYTRATDDGECPGAKRPFAIRKNLLLGHEVRTDVFELQINGLDTSGAAWAFGSALRTALTRELGVELSEVGLRVEPRITSLGQPAYAIFLFDHASGGAGFSARAKDLFAKLLTPIRDLLDCKVEGCITGCSACVLTPDLYDRQENVDRQAALSFFIERMASMATPGTADMFRPDASFSDDVIDELATGDGSVVVWCSSLDPAGLTNGGFLRLAATLQRSGRSLSLVIGKATLDSLDGASRLLLRDMAIRFGIELRCGSAPSFGKEVIAIAGLVGDRNAEIWATRDLEASALEAGWGVAGELPVLRATWDGQYDSEDISNEALMPRADAAFIGFTKECDGPLSRFGTQILALVKPLLERVGRWRPNGLVRIEYYDRYLKSPLSVRLACEGVAALSKAIGGKGPAQILLISEPFRQDSRFDDRTPWQANHDWRSDHHRIEVTKALMTRLGLKGAMTLRKDRHAREMILTFDDSASVTLIFDQGFGCWSTPRAVPLRFDFNADPVDQAAKLIALNPMLTGPSGPSYIVAHI